MTPQGADKDRLHSTLGRAVAIVESLNTTAAVDSTVLATEIRTVGHDTPAHRQYVGTRRLTA
jgi:hypothetical protein